MEQGQAKALAPNKIDTTVNYFRDRIQASYLSYNAQVERKKSLSLDNFTAKVIETGLRYMESRTEAVRAANYAAYRNAGMTAEEADKRCGYETPLQHSEELQ